MPGKIWTSEEIQKLRDLSVQNKGSKEISMIIGRTNNSVLLKLSRLSLSINTKKWKPDELKFIKNNFKILSSRDMSKIINRPLSSISHKLSDLGLKKDKISLSNIMKRTNQKLPKDRKVKKILSSCLRFKKCVVCGKIFDWLNNKKAPIKTWKKRKCCSRKCGELYRSKVFTNDKLKWSTIQKNKFIKTIKKKWEDKIFRERRIKELCSGRSNRPNKPEKVIMSIIKDNKLDFRYTGDGSLIIGCLNPDFVNKDNNKIIELYGDYWHNLPKSKKTDSKRVGIYKNHGYDTLIIWEHELENLKLVEDKLIKFATNS